MKLPAYMAPSLHHSGGTVCEPVDVPVAKRHLDMVYSHIRYSTSPFMGSVTHSDRALDPHRHGQAGLGGLISSTRIACSSTPHQRQFAHEVFDAVPCWACSRPMRGSVRPRGSRPSFSRVMSPVTVGTPTQILAEAAGGHGLPAHQAVSGAPQGLRHLCLVHFHAVGRAGPRHAGTGNMCCSARRNPRGG